MIEPLLAIFGLPGGYEWFVILIIALLVFGGRLPNVARSFGKSIVEFKRGLRDVKDDIDHPGDSGTRALPDSSQPAEPKAVESKPADAEPVDPRPVESESAKVSGGE